MQPAIEVQHQITSNFTPPTGRIELMQYMEKSKWQVTGRPDKVLAFDGGNIATIWDVLEVDQNGVKAWKIHIKRGSQGLIPMAVVSENEIAVQSELSAGFIRAQ